MRFVELFAGIGGFRLGLERAGMQCVWANEIDKRACEVYRRHWSDGTLHEGSIVDVDPAHIPEHDLLVGGFPCQDLSVAGKRKGLEGERSGLFFEIVRILERTKTTWVLLENVPGLRSSGDGRDLLQLLATLDQLGYGVAWRVLDAQYFGVPQRRCRVFIVGYLGAPCPVEVLFESQGMPGHSSAGGEAGEDVAASITASAGHHGRSSPRGDGTDNLVCGPTVTTAIGNSIPRNLGTDGGLIASTLSAYSVRPATGKWQADGPDNIIAHNVTGAGKANRLPDVTDYVLAFDTTQVTSPGNYSNPKPGDPCHPLTSYGDAPAIVGPPTDPNGVREAPGLPGRVDGTRIADGPRYRMLGNAVAVPVIEWIGRRLVKVNTDAREEAAHA